MEHSARGSSWLSAPLPRVPEPDRLERATVLVVEDDPDIREMLSMLLEFAGFGCVTCPTAEAGLEALRDDSFDFVLTDYALPERTGLWLLQTAQAEGLLDGAPALIVTAQPAVNAGGYEVMQKPFDLDELVARVRQRMDAARSAKPLRAVPSNGEGSYDGNGGEAGQGGTPPGDGGAPDGGRRRCPEPVELILYGDPYSPQVAAAVRHIEEALSRFKSSQVHLTVRDLATAPSTDPGNLPSAPTLVRTTSGPRTFIFGHLGNPDLVLELLAECGIEESEDPLREARGARPVQSSNSRRRALPSTAARR
jgi:CheY-like chemotaxis protein